MTLYPGNWCDVVAHPDGFAFVYQREQSIICLVNSVLVWEQYLPEPVLYLRAACGPDGTVRAIGQGNDTGLAWVVSAGAVTSYGPTFGQNCTVITQENDQFVLYIQRSVDTYSRWPLNQYDPGAQPIPIGPTSQGWLDVVDGEMRWTDVYRRMVIEGYTLILPVWRNGVTAGQGTISPDQITAVRANGQASTVIQATSWEPHIAALNDVSSGDVQTAATAALNAYDPPTNAELVARTLASADYATASALGTVDTEIGLEAIKTAAIKAKTDSLTFTKAGEVDANVQSINGTGVAGTGTSGDEWGPE